MQAVEQIFTRITNSIYNDFPIQISAQTYLIKMYEKFGFETQGEIFNLGKLPHIKMTHPALTSSRVVI